MSLWLVQVLLYTHTCSSSDLLCLVQNAGLMNRLQWMEKAYPYQRNDLACFKSSVGFVDHLTEAFGPLLAGTPLLIPSPETCKENPLSLLSFVKVCCHQFPIFCLLVNAPEFELS